MRKILIVVQARMSSSRFPEKVLKPILGKTLLFRMVERLKMVKTPAQIVIATSTESSDDAIEIETKNMGAPCFRGNLNDLLDRHYQAAVQFEADVVLKIPSDCPLIDPSVVDRGLGLFFEKNLDFLSNLHPATYPDGNDVEIMTFDCLQKAWREATRPLEREHTTPYIWENPDLFKIENFEWETGLDYSMSHRFTIDYEADYHFIARVFEELYPLSIQFNLADILTLLDKKPEIYALNAHYAGVNWYRNHLDELKTVTADQTRQTEG